MPRLLLLGLALALVAGPAGTADAQTRKNVILYIGDGYGISPKTAARMALGQGQDGSRFSDDPRFRLLASDRLPYNTTVTTHSLNSWVTDSAPGATVYSAGQAGKIDNEFIALDPSTLAPIETILEAAKKEGYAVGIVSTARITHATPASFASHIWNRNLEDYIAAQYVSTSQAEYEGVFAASPLDAVEYDAERDWRLPAPKVGVKLDVILGGGGRHWLPASDCPNADTPNADIRDRDGVPVADPEGGTLRLSGRRPDCVDLVQVARDRGYEYVTSRDGLLGLDLDRFADDDGAALLGLFNASHMLYEQERQVVGTDEPSLTDLTEIAVEVLERKSDKGFFLIVESGRIDHLEHANAGGIRVSGSDLVIDANFEAFFADGVYVGLTPDVPGPVYGSDYMIKEVLAFDYAIEAGRQYLGDRSRGETLIMQTADHECGGFAAVSLNDPSSDGTSRTYAQQPTQDGGRASRATPTGIVRGAAWFPQYQMRAYQGLMYPQAMESGPRIVISYGSNPVVNGNTPNVGSTPGNHTPSDIFVGAEDNVGGTYAGRIAGRGLLDNTDLTPIMDDFLGVVSGRTVTEGPETLPVFFADFDADGEGDPRGEFVVLTNGSDSGESADLSGTTFAVLDPLTEAVTFVASPGVVLAPGESLVLSNLDGTLPPNTLPDGPGALVHVEGAAAVGDDAASLDGRVIAAVIYRDEDNLFGTVRGDEEADPAALAEALAAVRRAVSNEAAGAVDLSLVTAPNPTTGRSRIAFGLAEAADVRVVVYDALGREVAVLADGPHTAGRHGLTFDGSAYPSGSYVVRVEGAETRTARLTVAR
jgi:alkaline phosphatase